MINGRVTSGVGVFLTLTAFAPQAFGQVLHTNDRWDECAIDLHPSLTQQAWSRFASELGIVTYFRPLASARPLGRKHVEVALLNWGSRIDDADPAWNDTFSHPDSAHWLMDGSSLYIPGLMARAGITDRIDVGAYITRSPGANYGFIGGQLQYSLVNDPERRLAAAGRLSVVTLYGPDEMEASTFGLEFVASTAVSVIEPYIALSGYMSRARETSPDVDLDNETAFGAQATAGVAAQVSVLRLGAEFNLAKVPGVSLKVGFGL
ncbi:MAG TPA: hypothetical protein VFZ24_08930 [Longimicrobiales bacterium]